MRTNLNKRDETVMKTRFERFRFNGKMKHYRENSKLYKAYKKSIEFMCEVEDPHLHFENAFTTNGKTYAVIEYYPKEYSFRCKKLNRWLNKRAWSGVYLQELAYVSLGSEK
jgi:hypothetical protein